MQRQGGLSLSPQFFQIRDYAAQVANRPVRDFLPVLTGTLDKSEDFPIGLRHIF
jgi:hypothetical protein